MNPKEVKKWLCEKGRGIAVNPYQHPAGEITDLRSKYWPWSHWAEDPANQPLTSLVGEFDAEDVKVVERWEFRTWDEENQGWFDWVSSTQKYCETLTGTHQTRQSYELIPKVKEVLPCEKKDPIQIIKDRIEDYIKSQNETNDGVYIGLLNIRIDTLEDIINIIK